MDNECNYEFLSSIVWINEISFSSKCVNLNILCIEGSDKEVIYNIKLSDIPYFYFTQEDFDFEFSVIDTFLERFNECQEVLNKHSSKMKDFWLLSFHSGIHHLLIGFKDVELIKL